MFHNCVIIGDRGLFPVLHFNQYTGDIGVIDDNINFFVFAAAPVVSHPGCFLIVKGCNMLVYCCFHHLAHFSGIGKNFAVH
ncbi:hypothetical protein SDC9_201919 [bioreactor metagenome]|uniref:Uncharacterized protein n=1 Tax=bioreactor metagenome TaxID=1076179 RepID=A0A645IV07_9ZZZZ